MSNQLVKQEESCLYPTESPQDRIVYDTYYTDTGWIVIARMPRVVPHSDRIEVLKSLKEYQGRIRSKYPLWDYTLVSGRNYYCLEIKRNKNLRELFSRFQKKASTGWLQGASYGK